MKQSGGVSFLYLYEAGDTVHSGAIAFTITIDPENNEIVIVDSQGTNYVPDNI